MILFFKNQTQNWFFNFIFVELEPRYIMKKGY
jgi:hypothetical protein